MSYTPQKKEWTIISKQGCPYCKKAKDLLQQHNQTQKIIEITSKNRDEIYKQIDSLTDSYRYFPVIFDKNANFIGGYTELKKNLSNQEEDIEDRQDSCIIN